ncbi:uncharacterized protein CDAR_280331 [Caerostris darwini]|uniref:Uncharacterized protein n=1 Tax=Caerostris darwini TaxID=1538125 RepID=A0AAV4VF75_9ARAC|nr:uncharacterized protein CDAR_280331 [Caerostris darwini]
MIGILFFVAIFLLNFENSWVVCQIAPYDFGISTKGEREGELSPAAIAGLSFGVVAVVAGLGVTILFCYYVHKKQKEQEKSSRFLVPSSERY